MFQFLNNLFIQKDSDEALKEYIKQEARLIDVRSPEEFEIAHAPGTENIPMQEIPHHLDKLDKKHPIIAFCRTGSRSDLTKEFLLNHGFEKVLNGGAWQQIQKLLEKAK